MFSQRRRHILAFLSIVLIAFIMSLFFKSCKQTRQIWFGQDIKIAVLIYSTDEALDNKLDAFYVYLNSNSKVIKVLSINTNILQSQGQTLRQAFIKTAAAGDRGLAGKNLFDAVDKMSGEKFKPDYYFSADFNTLSTMLIAKGGMDELLLKSKFKNTDDASINQLEIYEILLKRFSRMPVFSALSFLSNFGAFDTNLSRLFFVNLALYLSTHDNDVFFCVFPTRIIRNSLYPLKDDAIVFFDDVFLRDASEHKEGQLDGFIEIRNASGISGLALNAATVLRNADLDVLDFGNAQIQTSRTIIKDRKGNFLQAKKVARVLGAGKIIHSYDLRNSYDTTVFIGQDYKAKKKQN